MNEISELIVFIMLCSAFVLIAVCVLFYYIVEILPRRLYKHFNEMKQKEAETLRNQKFDREREEFEVCKSSQRRLPPTDNPNDDLDINNDSNWA